MRKTVIITGAILVALLLWFLHGKTGTNTTQVSPSIIVPSLPHLTYIVPEAQPSPLGNVPHMTDYDWKGVEDCGGCGVKTPDALIITSTHYKPNLNAGYFYIDTSLAYDPSLKGAANLARVPSPPIYQQYNAPGALFWWGWADGSDLTYTPGSVESNSSGAVNVKVSLPSQPIPKGTRVIFTNMGGVLPTGFFAPWSRDDGGSIISPITAIMYLGTHYNLDPSRSKGL